MLAIYLLPMDTQHLRALLTERNLTQKEVAVRMLEWFAVNQSSDPPKQTTLESKLSKLLNNDSEGMSFFEQDRRGEALAHAFEVPPHVVAAMLARVQLLLDPRLPVHAVEALQRQASADPDRVEVLPTMGRAAATEGKPDTTPQGPVRVAVAPEGDRITLRDASDRHDRAVVVLASDIDADYFKARGRRVSFLTRVPRGYQLDLDPALVPVPPAKTPPLWVRGEPQITHPDLTAWMRRTLDAANSAAREDPYRYGQRKPSAEEQILATADERGEEPAFSLDLARPWMTSRGVGIASLYPARHSDSSRDHRELLALSRAALAAGGIWWWSATLYAVGSKARAFAELLTSHNVVVDPPAIAAWFAALETRNPFEPASFADVREGLSAIGLTLEHTRAERNGQLFAIDSGGIERAEDPFDLPVIGEEEGLAVRAALRRTATRAMSRVPAEWIRLPLYLGLAAEASLSPLPKQDFDVVHVMANLGAGRVVRVRIAQFEGAGAGPLTFSPLRGHVTRHRRESAKSSCTLDGDGTHVSIETLYDELLEGSSVPARARRRRQAEEDADDD